MAGRYGAEVYIMGTVVPFHHSAYTLGEDHISIHQGKKHSNEIRGRTDCCDVVPNSKRTPLINVYLIYVLCSLLLHAQVLISKCLVRIF